MISIAMDCYYRSLFYLIFNKHLNIPDTVLCLLLRVLVISLKQLIETAVLQNGAGDPDL